MSQVELTRLSQNFYKDLLYNIDIGIYFVDKDRNIVFFNKAAEKITGYDADEVIGMSCQHNLFNHLDQMGNLLCLNGCPLHATIQDGQRRTADVFLHHKDGHRVPIRVSASQILGDKGEVLGAVETFYDSSNEYKIEQEKEDLKALAMEDELTSLPNRRYLVEWLLAKQREYKKFNRKYGILMVDIDNFKRVNDKYGHLIGDEMLKIVAKTMKGATRDNDISSRYGGEEFIMVLSGITEQKLHKAGKRLCSLIYNSTLEVGSTDLSVSVSIGGAMVEENDEIKDVIKRADDFLYQSKKGGKNRICSSVGTDIIGPEMNSDREIKVI